ncbi:hypothetical protein AADZ84_05770 [Colwelliaceae bacterium MEBiC 14330]
MDLLKIKKIRNQLIISVVILQIALLIWESLNGGVKTHHLFARDDLFGISNWWGLIILPLLVWITAYSIEHRSNRLTDQLSVSNFYKSVCVNFLIMLLMCLTSSTFFMLGFQNIAIYMLFAVLIIALFFPLYRIEAIVGYVLGGAFFTGPMIPFVGVILFVSVSAFSHFCIKPLIFRLKSAKTVIE